MMALCDLFEFVQKGLSIVITDALSTNDLRVEKRHLLKLDALTTAQAAAIGTAGFTAAMSVNAIRAHGVRPQDGPVLVTGATGGVGSVSVDLLAGLGYEVIASTGKADAHDYLMRLGATEVIGRLPAEGEKIRALGKSRSR